MSIRNIRVSTRISLGFTGLVLLLMVVGGGSLLQMQRMNTSSAEVHDNWLPSILALDELNGASMRVRISTLRAAVRLEADALPRIERERAGLAEAQERYRKLISNSEEQQIYERFAANQQTYIETQNQLLELLKNAKREEADNLIGQMSSRATSIASDLEALTKLNSDGATSAAMTSKTAYENAKLMVWLILAGTVALAIGLAVLLSRSIVRPLAQAVQVARTVASGNLSEHIQVEGRDEASQLLEALRSMQQGLRKTISTISDSSAQLASASEELHAVTDDSNRGLLQQNQEIEQAATACNEMSVAVDGVAHNAANTLEASRHADRTAKNGREQVQQTVQSINALASDVTGSAERVELLARQMQDVDKVLDVIRAIAEQTNLLALNAAIEAARAGEQGRGFAVVADEVRLLAQRTQQSTQEIEQMVGALQQEAASTVQTMQDSTTLAQSTVQLAEAANACLDDITDTIAAINEQNVLIASAAEEQAAVAHEVERNLTNIRDLSAQTAAGASQTSASSQDLSRLAVDLHSVVASFRL
ncbi:methyl-accepting chemotaxis protein [Pseudomonas aeruginosa]|uniref:methyl-accepting chemotaxis protein n=1 Tax=Pseudomonas aeruginosa TaxID=287 RepID=UPI0011CF2CD9|nr:methyl-accepting chemotaxis protein [Pseudomonas aeruginosa]MCV6512486.1 methyl-accepting chemotaxis protein [Pseudomonas aeruginosa]MDE9775559.1 methyl-accepting chemotaxis protein [Pseudomonas aeruginosa]MDI3890193.1 methyl-accepting chemotaxis protein [Pseudomonas aeruginosa]